MYRCVLPGTPWPARQERNNNRLLRSAEESFLYTETLLLHAVLLDFKDPPAQHPPSHGVPERNNNTHLQVLQEQIVRLDRTNGGTWNPMDMFMGLPVHVFVH